MTRVDSPGDLTRPHTHTHTQVRATERSQPSTATAREVSTAPVARTREAQNETDPIRRMWDALEQAGCKPHGETRNFRARCPAHEGSNDSALRVIEGADGRVVLGCYAHKCDWRSIVEALGLAARDLFPPGHRNARNAKPRPVKSLTKGAAFLDMLAGAGFNWLAMLRLECPYCMAPDAYVGVRQNGVLSVRCSSGCHDEEIRRAVETRAAIREKGREIL